MGGQVEIGCKVVGLDYADASETWSVSFKGPQGETQTFEAEHVISSAPMRELVRGIRPAVSETAKCAADSLKYRDFLTVMLIVKNRDAFHENWIYIHYTKVKVGLIQNFRYWAHALLLSAYT